MEDGNANDDAPLTAARLSVSLGGVDILDEVDLRADSATRVAVIGPNGAGKTTLLRALAGLIEPDTGRVAVCGEALEELDRREVARRLSLLRQAPPQVFDYSALELVLMGYHARAGRFDLPSSSQRERAVEAMEELAVADLADRPATVLSAGELQRVMMARTLVADTEVWLLDEPTAHLDVRHRLAMLETLDDHVDDGGTAVAALHDLSLVHAFFDEVAVVHEGTIRRQGAVDDVLSETLLSEVFEVPMRRHEVDGEVVWRVAAE